MDVHEGKENVCIRAPRLILIRMEKNEIVWKELADRVVKDFFPGKAFANLKTDRWKLLNFSSCFSVERISGRNHDGVYIKIPKSDIVRKSVLPTSQADRKLAVEEYKSLTYLSRHWDSGGLEVRYVEPLAFYAEYNAIISRRAYGRFLFLSYRSADHGRRFLRGRSTDTVCSVLRRIGGALNAYHRRSQLAEELPDASFKADRVIAKIKQTIAYLAGLGVNEKFLQNALERLITWRTYTELCPVAMTLKGLDIRNMLIDSEKRVYLLDPGKLKADFLQADLARFLVTCRILYWGTLWFFIRLRPAKTFENSFLEGYGPSMSGADAVLKLFTLKELFKHWHTAHVAVAFKRWPSAIKWIVRKIYIDPFYTEQIDRDIRGLR